MQQTRFMYLALISVLSFAGCAVSYTETKTGTVHLWGIGHLKMKRQIPNEGIQAVVTSVQTFGIALNTLKDNGSFSIGYQNTDVLTAISENTKISLEGPSADLFTLKIGSHFGTPTNKP